ncbi:MAG: ABC transporter ATP-binding protein [Promethearchaeota archaeon]
MNAVNSSIITETLGKTFLSSKRKIDALKNVNLSIKHGEIFGLLGPNGAGKTTLVRILTTLLHPSNGRAYIGGFDVIREAIRVRQLIGYAGQDTERSLHYRLSAYENMKYFGWLQGMSRKLSRERLEYFAERLGITHKLDREFILLSGGEKQAMVIIRALLHFPQIAILDEPSKSLDPLAARKAREMIREYAAENEATIVLTSHNMKELEELCDRLALIDQGDVLFCGTPTEIKNVVETRQVIEIEGELLTQDTLDNIAMIGEVSSIQSSLRWQVECQKGYDDLLVIVQLLKSVGSKARVKMVAPSLEDAFEHLVTRRNN